MDITIKADIIVEAFTAIESISEQGYHLQRGLIYHLEIRHLKHHIEVGYYGFSTCATCVMLPHDSDDEAILVARLDVSNMIISRSKDS